MKIREAIKKKVATDLAKAHWKNHISRAWEIRHTDKTFAKELLRRMKSWDTL